MIKKTIISISLILATSNIYAAQEQKNINQNQNQIQQSTQERNPNAKEISNDVLKTGKNFETDQMSYDKGFDAGYELGKKVTEEEMVARLMKMEQYLDSIFNFQRLYIENKIEPPKIVVRKSPIEVVENGKLMIIEQEQIEIIEPARLLPEPKNWKHFIIE